MSDRKKDHIELTNSAQVSGNENYGLYYEPLNAGLDIEQANISCRFLGADFTAPIWFSSMTGGTKQAAKINQNMAIVAQKYKLGMGLGSCRLLLDSDERIADFAMRKFIGDRPLYANIGIAQIDELANQNKLDALNKLVAKIEANGLIVHINPLQEAIQPEGDRWSTNPLILIKKVLEVIKYPLIVKEVGQGFGPQSLASLLELPLAAIELAGHGGTNFTKLEGTRHDQLRDDKKETILALAQLGHTPLEMLGFIEKIMASKQVVNCHELIISGGIKNCLQGHSLIVKSPLNAVYGQAKKVLDHALISSEALDEYIATQIETLKLGQLFLNDGERC
jgi:isopentenyl-diphosphate delta-isomerase